MEHSLMKMTYPISVDAARAVAERYRQNWEAAKARMDRAVAETSAARSSMPDNYWQEEHRAHGLYRSALLLVEVLETE
jgi:hypothetical protein